MKTGTIIGLFVAAAAAGTGIYFATRKNEEPTPEEQRADIKQAVQETSGSEKAARVDEMSTEEVKVVYDTIVPKKVVGKKASAGAKTAFVPPAKTTNVSKGAVVIRPRLFEMPRPASTVKYAAKPFAASSTAKAGVGAVSDTAAAVSVLKKYGII